MWLWIARQLFLWRTVTNLSERTGPRGLPGRGLRSELPCEPSETWGPLKKSFLVNISHRTNRAIRGTVAFTSPHTRDKLFLAFHHPICRVTKTTSLIKDDRLSPPPTKSTPAESWTAFHPHLPCK
eukprot:758788-Hanusia_phi.AAC.3